MILDGAKRGIASYVLRAKQIPLPRRAGAFSNCRRSLVAAIVYGENSGALIEDKGDGILP